MNKIRHINMLRITIEQIEIITSANEQLCFSDWTNQSQNATKKVLRWLYCQSLRQSAF